MMGVAYSQDLRDRVLAAVDGGLGVVFGRAPVSRQRVVYVQVAGPTPRDPAM